MPEESRRNRPLPHLGHVELATTHDDAFASALPSRLGRRMAEGAALLVDEVLPAVGYRQWVLTFDGSMAVRLRYDVALVRVCREDRNGPRGGCRPRFSTLREG